MQQPPTSRHPTALELLWHAEGTCRADRNIARPKWELSRLAQGISGLPRCGLLNDSVSKEKERLLFSISCGQSCFRPYFSFLLAKHIMQFKTKYVCFNNYKMIRAGNLKKLVGAELKKIIKKKLREYKE